MINMTARHEHAFGTHLNLLATDRTGGRLEGCLRRTQSTTRLRFVCLAMLFLNLDDREPFHGLLAGFVLAPLQFCLAFGDSPHHLEYVVARREV